MPTENETKHTPGPWVIDEKSDEFKITIHRKWDSIVKPEDTFTMGDYRGAFISEIQHQGIDAPVVKLNQAQANARLIASAPDLLEAAKLTLQKVYGMRWEDRDMLFGMDAEPLIMLRSAIAKAEGK